MKTPTNPNASLADIVVQATTIRADLNESEKENTP